MNALAGGFRRVASLGYRYSRTCLVIAGIIACTAPLALRDLRIETESASLLGPRDPVSRVYRETLAQFGEANPLIVQILHESAEPEVLDRFTDRLADRIRELPDVLAVEAKPPAFDRTPWSVGMTRAALLNSEAAVLEQFTERLEAGEIRRQLRRTRKRLLLADSELRRNLISDPLDVAGILQPFFEQRLGDLHPSASRDYYDAPDRESRLLFVQPAGSAEDTEYCEGLIEQVRQAIVETRAATVGAESITHRLTGKFVAVGESAIVLRHDMLRISGIAAVLVLALILLVFRGWRATVICGLPILLSLPLVLWLARLFFNPLNFFAVGFIAIVMGLGVDALLHCTARLYQYLSDRDGTLKEATVRALADCGPPVLIGTVTTAGAFLCLTVSDYQGLVDFGELTAAALVVSFCSSMVLLPAVVRLVRPQRGRPGSDAGLRLLPRPLALYGWHHPGITLIAGAALVAVSLVIARDFDFDPEFKHLLPDRLDALDAADEIARRYGASFLLSSELVLEARSFDQAIDLQQAVEAVLMPLVASGTVVGFQSPLLIRTRSSISPEKELLRERAAMLLDQNRTEYRRSLADLGFAAAESHQVYYDHLIQAAASEPDFAAGPLPAIESDARHRRFLARDETGARFRTLVWLPDGTAGAAARSILASRFGDVEAGDGARIRLTGTHQMYEHLNGIVGSNFMRISGVSIAVVAVLLMVFFRNPVDAALGLLPILAAIPVVLAAIVVSGIPFPPLGAGMMAIVLGIGIDDAVHLLSRPKMEQKNDLRRTLLEVGPVISLTSLTSAIGFGALAFASHQVLSSLGVVVVVGILTCWLFSIGLLPAAYRLMKRRGTTSLLLFGILGAWIVGGSPLLAQKSKVEETLNKIERNYRSIESVTCKFSQQRRVPELTDEIEVEGELTFKVPNLLRITWQGDENLDLYVDGETIWLVDHDLEEVDTFEYDSMGDADRLGGLVPPFLFLSVEELRDRFEIRERESPGAHTRLEFKARDPSAEASWSFDLEVDGRARVRSVEEDRGDGEFTKTQFRHWRRRPAIPDDHFRYRPDAEAPQAHAVGHVP